jgi:hypothetical protein
MREWTIEVDDYPTFINMNISSDYQNFKLNIYSKLEINKMKAKVDCSITQELSSRNCQELIYFDKQEKNGNPMMLSLWIGEMVKTKMNELEKITSEHKEIAKSYLTPKEFL